LITVSQSKMWGEWSIFTAGGLHHEGGSVVVGVYHALMNFPLKVTKSS